MDVACRLADEHGSTIAVLHVVEIPPVLPLGAHMTAEEEAAHRLLERHAAIADTYGVGVAPRLVRDRDAGSAIVEQAQLRNTELIVIGAPRRLRAGSAFGSTVEHVLKRARCRVVFIGSGPVAQTLDAAA